MNKNTVNHQPARGLRFPFLALVVALQCSPLLAAEKNVVGNNESAGTSLTDVTWLSGGVGEEALAEMRDVTGSYNVHVLFSDRTGAYLASIPFQVARANGPTIASGVSAGPLLYLKLKPGAYQVSAEIDGGWQHKQIVIASSRSSVEMSFISAGK